MGTVQVSVEVIIGMRTTSNPSIIAVFGGWVCWVWLLGLVETGGIIRVACGLGVEVV